MDADEDVEPLSIGIVLEAGPQRRRWDDAVTQLGRRVTAQRTGVETPLSLNVVFFVPSKLVRLDWAGERTGTYSKKRGLLMIQVALPEEPPEDIDAYLHGRLSAAVDEAERWARKRRLADELDGLRTLIASL